MAGGGWSCSFGVWRFRSLLHYSGLDSIGKTMTIERLAKLDQLLGIRRSLVLFITLYLTWECYRWASEFAVGSDRTGIDIAAIIAAVTAPISLLQASVFKAYLESKA